MEAERVFRTEIKLGMIKGFDAFHCEQERLAKLGHLAANPFASPAEAAAAREAILATIRHIKRWTRRLEKSGRV